MIILDTSVLVDALTGAGSPAILGEPLAAGERIVLPAPVLYEWLRGPRSAEEIEAQEAMLPTREVLPFGAGEATVAAGLYATLERARGRELDIAIAAHALVSDAPLWTLNRRDFEDIPDLRLWEA